MGLWSKLFGDEADEENPFGGGDENEKFYYEDDEIPDDEFGPNLGDDWHPADNCGCGICSDCMDLGGW